MLARGSLAFTLMLMLHANADVQFGADVNCDVAANPHVAAAGPDASRVMLLIVNSSLLGVALCRRG